MNGRRVRQWLMLAGPAVLLLLGVYLYPLLKLLVTSRALRLRRDRPELFREYTPVAPVGDVSDHLVAFDRGGALTVATRLPVGLARAGGWGDTVLSVPPGTWRDVLTENTFDGGLVPLADLLARYPVALLARDDA